MNVDVEVPINGSREAIWNVITDIEGAADRIEGIEQVEILERPESGLVGLKWRETRTMFGKTATEEMWITAATENESYTTRAESHGSIYTSSLRISGGSAPHTLTMDFGAEPQGCLVKIMAIPMGILFKGSMRKMILKDLEDIKKAVEGQ